MDREGAKDRGEEDANGGCMIGKMEMVIPPFVQVEHDEATRKAYVTVEDKEVKKQREMWGAYFQISYVNASSDIQIGTQTLTFTSLYRHNPRLSPKSHPRRLRRPHCHSPPRRCRLQSHGRIHCYDRPAGFRGTAIRPSQAGILASD